MKGIDEEGNDAETDILDMECRLEKLTQQIKKEEISVEIETLTQEEPDKCDMVRSVVKHYLAISFIVWVR